MYLLGCASGQHQHPADCPVFKFKIQIPGIGFSYPIIVTGSNNIFEIIAQTATSTIVTNF